MDDEWFGNEQLGQIQTVDELASMFQSAWFTHIQSVWHHLSQSSQAMQCCVHLQALWQIKQGYLGPGFNSMHTRRMGAISLIDLQVNVLSCFLNHGVCCLYRY